MYKELVVAYEEYSGIPLEQLRKFMKTSVLIPSFQTQIWNKDLLNMYQECYPLNQNVQYCADETDY